MPTIRINCTEVSRHEVKMNVSQEDFDALEAAKDKPAEIQGMIHHILYNEEPRKNTHYEKVTWSVITG